MPPLFRSFPSGDHRGARVGDHRGARLVVRGAGRADGVPDAWGCPAGTTSRRGRRPERFRALVGVLAVVPVALLGACSGAEPGTGGPGTGISGTTSVPGTPSTTSTTTVTSSQEPVAVRPAEVSGYDYGKPSTGMADAVALSPEEKVFTTVSVNGVRKKGTFVGDFVIYGVSPEITSLDGFDSMILEMVRESVAGKGSTVKETTIEGRKVSVITKGAGRTYVWYAEQRLMLLMTDKGLPLGKRFVTAYLKVA